MTTETFDGTVRLLGVRASFKKSKELLADALSEGNLSPELSAEIEAFLSQFE